MSVLKPAKPVFVSTEPFDGNRVGAAAVYCSDGRFGGQMDEFLHKGLGLPRYDRVAVPGGGGCLAGHLMIYHEKNALEQQLAFLIEAHALTRVVFIAHEQCGFYKNLWLHDRRPIEHHQAADLIKAADLLHARFPKLQIDNFFARTHNGRVVFDRWSEKPKPAAAVFEPTDRTGPHPHTTGR